MGALDGRVIIVTGGGRGVGRAHALLFAAEGANVVVNDLGSAQDGTGVDLGPADEVVAEIKAAGGEAVANGDSVADWEGAQRIINQAVETYGDLHAVVNNAGILRDRMLVNMTEEEFDLVINVHQKGTWLMMRHAAAYWREQVKAGKEIQASIVNTSSTSGLHSNPGQINYGAAKGAIATMSIIAAQELKRYGVRVNAIAPSARTRMTLATPGLSDRIKEPEDGSFDVWDPANISPLVGWLCAAECPATAQVYWIGGNRIGRYQEWTQADAASTDDMWSIESIAATAGQWETTHRNTRSRRITGSEKLSY
ncbi:MAG: NAD(P)-dependent dehydrogenase (short-subunit alcohol dehydrogenase family) [Acidimicrobiales bacterium]|jgi:NAD(P)-dependent dehydrogenase (short-subunit alcohol dehydrogenase family)